MPRLKPVDIEKADDKTKELLEQVKGKFGRVPNILATMANAPAALEAYMKFSGALGNGSLNPKLREKLALAVGELNQCHYCLAAHTALGQNVGLSEQEIMESRQINADDENERIALKFAETMIVKRGWVEDEDVAKLRDAGFDEEEIVEIIFVVFQNIMTNFFNHIARIPIDFPEAQPLKQ